MSKEIDSIKAAAQAYAKELFLQIGPTGKRKYSLSQMVKKIYQKFTYTCTRQTIVNWAKAENWEQLESEIKNYGLEKVRQNKKEIDERVAEAKSDERAELMKMWKYVLGSLFKEFKTKIDTGQISEMAGRDVINGLGKAFDAYASMIEIKAEQKDKIGELIDAFKNA